MKQALLFCVLALVAATTVALAAPSPSPREVLRCAREAKLIERGESDACFMISSEEEGSVTLREKHSRTCGGDPEVAPARGFFRWQMQNGKARLGYEAGGDSWKPCGR